MHNFLRIFQNLLWYALEQILQTNGFIESGSSLICFEFFFEVEGEATSISLTLNSIFPKRALLRSFVRDSVRDNFGDSFLGFSSFLFLNFKIKSQGVVITPMTFRCDWFYKETFRVIGVIRIFFYWLLIWRSVPRKTPLVEFEKFLNQFFWKFLKSVSRKNDLFKKSQTFRQGVTIIPSPFSSVRPYKHTNLGCRFSL